MESTHREQEIIDIRAHHIYYLLALSEDIQRISGISFANLYEYQEVAKQLSVQIAEEDADLHYRVIQGLEQGNEEYSADMVGVDGSLYSAFSNSTTQVLLSLFTLPPETPVLFTIKPDIICRACQINGSGNPGNHCLVSVRQDEYPFNDELLYFMAIYKYASSKAGHSAGVKINQNGTVSANLGLVRNSEFLQRIDRLYLSSSLESIRKRLSKVTLPIG